MIPRLFEPYTESLDDSLYHYGVKGMRWGVRRDRGEASKARKARKAETKAKREATKAVAAKNKALTKRQNASTLTDKELRDRIGRLQLEKQYNDLINGRNPFINTGERIVNDLLYENNKRYANQFIRKVLG